MNEAEFIQETGSCILKILPERNRRTFGSFIFNACLLEDADEVCFLLQGRKDRNICDSNSNTNEFVKKSIRMKAPLKPACLLREVYSTIGRIITIRRSYRFVRQCFGQPIH
jgi:hypothetical protein